jgi:protein-tyrosine phosphatase
VLEVAPNKLRSTFTLTEAGLLATSHGAQSINDLADLRGHLSADDILDIPDPIGQSTDVFAAVGKQIAELLPPILEICRPE